MEKMLVADDKEWQIAIFGTFDVANYGDLLFPILAERELSKRLGQVKLHRFSYHARQPPAWPYAVTSVTDLPELAGQLDAVLIGGGFIVRFDKIVAADYLPPDPLIHHPTGYWLTPALIALQRGIPVIWNAPGMHCNDLPPWAVPMLRLVLEQSARVRVRDAPSRSALAALTDTAQIDILPDTAFGLPRLLDPGRPSEDCRRLRAESGLTNPYLVVHAIAGLDGFLRFWRIHAECFPELQLLVLPIGPVLGDHESILDDDLPRSVRLPYWPQPELLAELLGGSAGVIGHSYHLAITAIAFGIPVFCSADLSSGKYSALTAYEGVHQLVKDADIDPQWFLAQLGKRPPSAAATEALARVDAHWDEVARIIRAGKRPTEPAVNRFWQALPGYIETSGASPLPSEEVPGSDWQGLYRDSQRQFEELAQRSAAAADQTAFEIEACRAARDSAWRERHAAIVERDAALAHIDFLKGTRSWRITRPLRALLQLLRHGSVQAEPGPMSHAVTAVLPAPPASTMPAAIDCPAPTNATDARFDIVCLANIEWAARFQRPQQLMSQFARQAYRVFYVVFSREPPAGEPYSLAEVAPGVFEVALRVHAKQNHYRQCISCENRSAAMQAMQILAEDFKIKTAVTVVHLPYWTALADSLRRELGWRVQYDCMDDWVDFPEVGEALLKEEEQLVASADLVTVTAAVLEEKWASRAKNCLLVRNGVDFDFFARHGIPNDLLADITGPVIGYYGALAEWVDFALVAAIADARPDWNIVLIGDIFVSDLGGLEHRPNVHLTGRKPYREMPLFLYRFDVCIIPFRLYNVTHAVDPVKFYEFISAGKPVVSVPLEEMRTYEDYVYFASEPRAFVGQIERALAENDLGATRKRVDFARKNDWKVRFEANLQALIDLHPKVSIIIVTYNNVELTRGCIDSLLRNTTYPNFEIVVVDNASTDDTRNYLRYLNRIRPDVVIALNDSNRGFAAANNQGINLASGEYFVLLNNDTVVPKGWVDPLLRHLENPEIGLVGPVTNSVGNEAKIEVDYIRLDQMEDFADRHTLLHRGRIFDIAMLAMFCVAMRREVFEKIGCLDEAFGIGMFEDDDYSRRIQAAGLRTVCAEDAFVHHYGQASFKKLIVSGEYQALWDRNQAYFERKWGGWTPHQTRQSL